MFNMGFTELVVLGVIALLFIKPDDLPGVARTVGRLLNELKRAGDDALGSFKTLGKDATGMIQKSDEDLQRLTVELMNSFKENTEPASAETPGHQEVSSDKKPEKIEPPAEAAHKKGGSKDGDS